MLADGEVSLDGSSVAVDRWNLDAALAAAESAQDADIPATLADVISIYAGPLLPDDTTEWVEAERRRLRLRIDAVLAKGAPRIPRAEAASLLSRALAADPELALAEDLLRAATRPPDSR